MTVEPAAIEGHAVVFSVIVRPLLLAVVVGTVPDWRHEPEIRATLELLIPAVTLLPVVESPMVTVFPVASAFTATKVTV